MEIIQWNINGYYKKIEQLSLLIHQQNPICLCLQETNFIKDRCASLKSYNKFYKNRLEANRASGGVAIFAKPSTLPEPVPIVTELEAIAIRIKYPTKVTICNIYLPNSQQLNIEELTEIINQLPKPIMILGDFNSHHENWGSDHNDPRGNLIAE